jgi:hypothetical protein
LRAALGVQRETFMIVERPFPLLKLAAAAGAVIAGVWLAKKLKKPASRPRQKLAPVVEVRPVAEVPWGIEDT